MPDIATRVLTHEVCLISSGVCAKRDNKRICVQVKVPTQANLYLSIHVP